MEMKIEQNLFEDVRGRFIKNIASQWIESVFNNHNRASDTERMIRMIKERVILLNESY